MRIEINIANFTNFFINEKNNPIKKITRSTLTKLGKAIKKFNISIKKEINYLNLKFKVIIPTWTMF